MAEFSELQFQAQKPEFCPSLALMLKSCMGFVLLVPAPGPDSQLLVRNTGAEWWRGRETQITLEINNDLSYIRSLLQHKALQADAALIIALF